MPSWLTLLLFGVYVGASLALIALRERERRVWREEKADYVHLVRGFADDLRAAAERLTMARRPTYYRQDSFTPEYTEPPCYEPLDVPGGIGVATHDGHVWAWPGAVVAQCERCKTILYVPTVQESEAKA